MSWNPPSSQDFPDSWSDPDRERDQLYWRLSRYRWGFSSLGLSLIFLSVVSIGWLILLFSGHRQPIGVLLGLPRWELIEESLVVWGTLIGGCLIWGQWPDKNWQRRSGLLLMMFFIDLGLWSLDHGTELGLTDVKMGHEWLRRSMGQALGWSELALMASLAADLTAALGEPRAIEFGKAARSLSTTGAMVWFMYFYVRTDWNGPIWPLRELAPTISSVMLSLGLMVLLSINFVQVGVLSLMAARSCVQRLREMKLEAKSQDLLPSRSEAGWDDLKKQSDFKRGG